MDAKPTTYTFTVSRIESPLMSISIEGPNVPVNEGEELSLTVAATGSIEGFMFSLQQEELGIATVLNSTTTLSIRIPADSIAREMTTQGIVFELIATDGLSVTHAARTVTIVKVDNGGPSFAPTVSPPTISIAAVDDPDGEGMATYVWEQRGVDEAGWEMISNISDTYTVPEAQSNTLYRIHITYTDAQGYTTNNILGPYRSKTNIDDDGDGLIDIYYLEDLDKVRYQLDGSGYKESDTADTITAGCPDNTCIGYELRRDLDFSTTQSYINVENKIAWTVDNFSNDSDTGWNPIGGAIIVGDCNYISNRCFNSIFEGNGKRISNLQINRNTTAYVGLFRANLGSIRNIELANPRVEVGDYNVIGALVGFNQRSIINSGVVGGFIKTIENDIGGLVGRNSRLGSDNSDGIILNSYVSGITVNGNLWVGGLCGSNEGRIINSYADATVNGMSQQIGGLAGRNRASEGRIVNSYATGSVSSRSISERRVGGLLGQRPADTIVTNSYATARVASGGGLIGGRASSRNVNDSYWDIVTSGRTASGGGGIGKMTSELQSPIAATDVYANWSNADWDFGNTMSYPALRYNNVEGVNACDSDPDTPLPRCSTLLPNQPGRDSGLGALYFVAGSTDLDAAVISDRLFSSLEFNYNLNIPFTETFQLEPHAIKGSASVSIIKDEDTSTDYFADRLSGERSIVIPLQAESSETLRIIVKDVDPPATSTYIFNARIGTVNPVEVISFSSMPASGSTVNEGDDINLSAEFGFGSGRYEYSLQRAEEEIARGITSASAVFTSGIPEDFVDAARTTQNIVFTITANDGLNTITADLMLIVNKTNKDDPQFELNVSPATLSINHTADDSDGVGIFTYQWQQRDRIDVQWMDSAKNTGTSYTVPANANSTIRYRVRVRHRDGQGYTRNWEISPFPADIDGNDNGLIDIYYLEDLDVVRHQSDGSGYQISAVPEGVTIDKITAGCPLVDGVMTCAGYEMLRDLDFAMDDSYVDATTNTAKWMVDDFDAAGDTGWLPIGDEAEPFASVLDGNNYVISNLQINRDTAADGHIGLFGVLSRDARIENMALLDVNIQGRGDVGSLVAENKGTIINSYAEGGVVWGIQHRLGGLVAINGDGNDTITIGGVIVNSYANVATTSTNVLTAGGLVGSNRGTIRNSYAAGNAIMPCDVGGLVGENRSSASGRSQVINSYALGDVRRLGSCTNGTRNRASGLVALNEGLISNSLARGQIIGRGGSVGGVVAAANKVSDDFPAEVEYSYFDSTVNSDITADADDGISKTSDELIMPMAAGTIPTEIYYQWSTADWNFGTTQTYPLLRYTDDVEGSDAMACDTALNDELPLCGGLLPGQHVSGLSDIVLFADELPVDESAFDKAFSYLVLDYAVNIEDINTIRLTPRAIHPRNKFISIIKDGESPITDYFVGKRSGEQSEAIPVSSGETNLMVRVGNSAEDPAPVVYNFIVDNTISPVVISDIRSAPSSTRNEGETITLSAMIEGSIQSNYRYNWSSDLLDLSGQDTTAATLSFNIPTDFVPRNVFFRNAVLKLTVTDGFSVSSATETVTIVKVNNGDPSFIPRVTISTISIMVIGDEADGNGVSSYIWEQRSIDDTDWKEISDATMDSYMPLQAAGDTRYRVRVHYTDAQGYSSNETLGPFRIDIDDDDDGLIDIYYLEDLDKVRYQLDGSGYKESGTADKITVGCRANTCIGYELRRDLDFSTTQSYINVENKIAWTVDNFETNDGTDTGWDPIGGAITNGNCTNADSRCFSGIFEGNGKRISNLQINKDNAGFAGLFRANLGSIRNIELANPEVEVVGQNTVGALAGFNQRSIMNSGVVGGFIKATGNDIGGITGRNGRFSADNADVIILNSYVSGSEVSGNSWVGGICGSNESRIINSYVHATVSGIGRNIGGLAAHTRGNETNEGEVVNSYAAGVVSLAARDELRVGGLLGERQGSVVVANSYATARVMPASGSGLIGLTAFGRGEINDNYWDTSTSGQADSTNTDGTGKTTSELQSPIAATGIYANWSANDWDFGNTMSYPALRYNYIVGVDACDLDPDTPWPHCGTLLPGQPGRDSGLSALLFNVKDINLDNTAVFGNQSFSSLQFNYTVTIPYTTAFQLRPYAIDRTASISIKIAGDETDYFVNKSVGDLSNAIPLPRENMPTTLTVSVASANPMIYHFVVSRTVPDTDIMLDITNPANGAAVNEGDTITATVGGDNNLYSYLLESGEMKRTEGSDSGASLSLDIPEDLSFASNTTTQRVVFTLSVNNGRNGAEAEIELIVSKQNNGEAQLELSVSPATLRIDAAAADPDGVGTFTYQWQQRDAGDTQWIDPTSNTGISYTVPADTNSIIRYRVRVAHRDGQGYTKNWEIGPFPADIDGNDNGLIDIYYLEDLNVVRHQSDGSGYQISAVPNGVTADKITSGCPLVDSVMTCAGYEMLRDLDFAIDGSYVDATANKGEWTVDDFDDDTADDADAADTGWLPIGDEAEAFNSVLDGNNYVISNLQINRDTADDGHIGLFGVLSGDARIENMGLLDVNIQGRGNVGSLVAENKGTIINSYAEGGIVLGTQHSLGGLVAINGDGNDTITIGGVIVNSYADVATTSTDVLTAGGLVGSNRGTIRNSYATGNAIVPCDVGGLVGENRSSASGRSRVINSYALGDVRRLGSCTDTARNRVSGLVALNEGLISNSLARGQIISGGSVGGVVAEANMVSDDFPAEVEYSYFDSTVNDDITADDDDGISKTSDELMMPIAAGTTITEIYYQWSTADWDFGTTQTYPLLRYTGDVEGSDAVACDADSNAELPLCGGLLPGQHDERLKGLSGILFFAGNALLDESAFDKSFSSLAFNYTMSVEEINTIRLAPYAINPRSEFISIIKDGESPSTDYFAGKRSGEQSRVISVPMGETDLIVRVGNTPGDADPVLYNFSVNNTVSLVELIDLTIIPASRVDEGQAIILSAKTGGGVASNYRYQWSSDSSILSGQDTTAATLSFNIPTDFVPSDVADKSIVIKLIVTDGLSVSSATETVTIVKVNNSDPSFTSRVTTSTISIMALGDELDGESMTEYIWEQRGVGDTGWKEIDNMSNTYTVLPEATGDIFYRVSIVYSDAQGYIAGMTFGPYRLRIDIDDDDDGLIDIYYLEDLDKVRYQLDGSGYKENGSADKITAGCPDNICIGYELRTDLDFATTQSYVDALTNKSEWTVDNFDTVSDTGWVPIGYVISRICHYFFSNCFSSTFEGNGKRISNLQINRDSTNYIGLFAGNSGSIRNLRLAEPEIEGRAYLGALLSVNRGTSPRQATVMNSNVVGGSIKGSSNIGGLVSINSVNAIILNSYASVNIEGSQWIGGLVGTNKSRIINSYAAANVADISTVIGGLVGNNGTAGGATIENSYATGSVLSSSSSDNIRTGGLVGHAWRVSNVIDSYAITSVKVPNITITNNTFGGLIGGESDQSGEANDSTVENSYWNSDTSGQTRSAGGTSKTTIELQTPTTATGIYADWSSDDWDFGTAMSYPALRYNEIDGVDACDSDPDTALPRCGTLLSDQPERDNGLGALFFVVGGAELDNDAVFGTQPFSSLLFNYIVEIPYATALQLRPYAVNNDANISIRQTGNNTDYFANKSGGDLSDEIPLSIENVPTTVTIVVSDANPTTYHFVVRRAVLDVDIMLSITDPAPGSTVNEGDTITAMVIGNSDAYSYSFAGGGIEIASGRGGSASLNLDIPKDLSFAGNATTQRIVFTLSVDNNRNGAEAEIELIVSKQNNGEAQLELNVSPATLRIDSTADDPDGVGAFTYQWQQRDADDGQWMDPVNNTGASYTVSLTANSTIRYRVRVRHSDGQGYTKNWDIGSFPADIDGNDNGLIDIYYLEDLDVVRHQSDGSGYQISSVPNGVTADKITSGCPMVDGVMVCAGYEMLRDLDFTMDNSYVDATANKSKWTVDDFSIDSDTGWLPIGDEANPFAAVLDGNNYAIYNLDINRDTADDGHIGLFGVLSGNARIENMALLDVNIQGRGNVGSLVAENKGTVINSYVGGGAVLGEQHSLGGLVAINGDDDDMITIEGVIVNSYANVVTISVAALTAGGLVGSNRGTIRNSYALGNARGSCDIGGLVGENRSSASGRSQIINSYASVDVSILGSCTNVTRNRASALVAFNEGLISNSLARGQIISGGSSIGGVVAEANDVSDDFPAEVEYSYFDSTVNGDITADDDDGLGKTSDELIMPIAAGTTPTEIYYQWSTDDWDFGTAMEYPALKYTSATNVLGKPACSESASQALPQCGTAVPNQRFGLSSLQLSAGTKLEAAFNYAVSAQSAIVRNGTEEIRVTPTAFNNNATIEIIVAGADGTDYSRGNGMNSNPIPLDSTSTVIIITVSAAGESAVRYTINTEILEAFQVSENVSAVIDNTAVDREALSEGETVNLSFRVSGGDVANYRYRWRVSVANTDIATATDLMLDEQQSNAAITISIPDNFIKSSTATSTQLTLTAAIDDMLTATERRSVGFKVLKANNGSPVIDLSVSTSTLSISADSVDPDGGDNYVYAWWQQGIEDSSWMPIADTGATYTILNAGSSGANRYRVRVIHTDGQGYETRFSRGPFAESPTDIAIRTDVDDDDDGLIDIYYLEDLDAIRYQLDGSGYRANDATSKISDGCLAVAEVVQCRGYELRRSLDFDNNAHYIDATNKESWTTGLGWQPIGDFFNAFSTQFRANPANDDSLTISNLMVNRQNIEGAALFGVSSTSSEIYGVRLLDVEVNGRFTVGALVGENYGLIANSSVSGTVEGTDGWIGGLVGTHFGTIVNSYARADVKGQGSVGGLVGYNGDDGTNAGLISHSYAFGNVEGRNYSGGLVGYSQGTIVNSYASGSVVSAFYGGGLVGFNERYRLAGTIRNAYARGTVIGSIYLGGLAGYNASVIDNTYASGAVIGSDGVGGLVGISADPGRVSNSYWDAAASGVAISAGGIAAMSTALQTSTATQSIYAGWSAADWSFGSADTPKYPTLKYNASSEGDMSLCGDAFLPACGSELPTPEQLGVESSHGRGSLVLTGLQLSEGTLEPAFDPTKTDYELLDVSGAATTVTATAKNASVRIRVNEQAISMSLQASLSVALADLAQHDIVIELSGADRSTQTYTIVLPAAQPALSGSPIGECSLNDIDKDDDGLIEICDIEGLHAMRYQLDGSGYQTSKTASEITSGCDEDGNRVCIGYELMQDLDFNDPAHYRESANQAIWTVSDYDDSMDKGWLPIGDLTNPFVATFNANGYTISNLQINRGDSEDGRDYAGLFSHIGANAQLREVALVEIEVRGRFVVGGLVGLNDGGAIINSHVLGRIEGSQTDGLMNSSWIGGMVGSNDGLIINSYADVDVLGHTTIGGLVGFADRRSRIRNSYALSDVKGRNSVGGLVGVNQGSIRDSYAGGSVDAVRDEINPLFESIEVDPSCRRCEAASQGGVNPAPDIVYYAGGLVGYNDEEGIIINGYAYSSVSGGVLDVGFTGGLVGANLSEPDETNIVNGYWDRDASGVEFSSGSNEDDGLTMEEIQLPSSFEGWSDSDWNFETGEEYPRLRYVAGEDADEPACETPPPDTELPNCGVLLFGQGFELQSIGLRNAVLFPSFDIAIRNYAANVSAETTKVEVIAIASDRAELRVNGEEVSSGEYKVINLDEGDIKIKVVSDSEEVTTYTIVVVRQAEEAAFVQSRFAGQPSDLVCRDCNPTAEGAVRIRFAPQSLALLTNNRVSFKLQFRTIAGAVAGHYVSSAGFGLRYNPAAFGENLNTPVLDPYTMGMSQCTYGRSDFFDNLDDYNINFSDTAADELNIAEIGSDRNADRGQLNALGTEWSDLVTMTCTIANVSEEAGLAIAGSDPRQIELRKYDDDGDAIPSLALLLADNDLRGLRLDGKTYVEDSTRYSDGSGVRLKFSKGVAVFAAASGSMQSDAMPLMPRNFSLDATADTMISTVTHIAGSTYAEIEFNEAVPSDILRLASTATYKIYAVDEGFVQGEELAHGNFAAALAYDANAPAVVDVGQVNTATWSLTFDKPIHPGTVSKENLCLTNEMDVCADEVQGTSITSVSLMGEDNQILQVEIGSAEQTERIAAIEFRRNAMLGADFRVVEGYQLELRDAITIADGVPPTITVEAMGAAVIQEDPPQTHETITYSVRFTVSANEAIAGLDEAASYRLLRLPNSGEPISINAMASVQTAQDESNRVIVRYIGIRVPVSDVESNKGFTLARANSSSLQDLSGKDPLGSDSGFLDSRGVMDEGAIALTGDLDDTTLLASLRLSAESEASALMFNPTTTTYRIAGVANATTYTTVSATAQNPAKISRIKSSTLEDDIEVDAINVQSHRIPLTEGRETTITLVVTAQDGESEQEYIVVVERLPSADESLTSLEIASASGSIELDPMFSEDETDYTAGVASDLSVTISAEAAHPQATIQIAKGAITEDTPSVSGEVANATIELNLRTTTTVIIRVTAQDEETAQDYIVAVTRLPSEDESLASLGIASASGSIALDPVFADDETDYTAEVSGDLSVTISAEATHPQSTIQIAKEAITGDTPNFSGESASATIELNLKTTTTVVIRVIAEDGIIMQDYTIALTRVPEADATLETLTIAGDLVADFDPAIAEYTVEVEGKLAIDLFAKATHDQAMIQIAGTSGVGEVSTQTQLNLRTTTTIVIEVSSEDRENTRAYTIAVIRLPSKDASLESLGIVGAESGAVELLPGGFASTRTDYMAEMASDLSVTISAGAAHPQATIQIAKGAITEDTPSVSGEVANATIDLNLKTTTTVVIRVIAEDGIAMQDYTIAVTRLPSEDESLASLGIASASGSIALDPVFADDETDYTAEVSGDLSVTISAGAAHPQATIQIAKEAITEDTPGVSGEVANATIELNLKTTTTVVIRVIAEDGIMMQDYTIALIRVPEADATLETLTIAEESVADFDPAIAEYIVEVEDNLEIELSAKATHDKAMIQIAGTSGIGQVSTRTQLNLRTTTTIVIEVTSEDGENTRAYTIAVTRLPSEDASLESLGIVGAESGAVELLPGGFASTRTDYMAEMASDLSVTISAEATHPQATIQIAKGAITEDTPSVSGEVANATIELNLKTTTTVVIRVIAEDGIAMQDYIVAVTSADESLASACRDETEDESLASLGIASASGSIELDPVFADDETDYTAEVSGDLSVTISAEATHPASDNSNCQRGNYRRHAEC